MKYKLIFSVMMFGICLFINTALYGEQLSTLSDKRWFAGSANCEIDTNPAIEIFEYNPTTFILRQNKCLHYEAPFIYLLLGNEKALLLDTGATKDEAKFPLARTVQKIIQQYLTQKKRSLQDYSLMVVHSHSHGDHVAADQQFTDLEGVTVIPPNQLKTLQKTLLLNDWPTMISTLDLGDRNIKIIPTPGHHKDAISLYDEQTHWLLTGDTFYPGRLYVRDWPAFKNSIARLSAFSTEHRISVILGAHIEMSAVAKADYPMGATFHPNEAPLVLTKSDLKELQQQLSIMGNRPAKVTLDKFIIFPLK